MLSTDADLAPTAAPPLTPRELGRATITYALGGLAYKGVALLAVPILARLLTPAELGLLDLAAVAASLVALVVTLGTDQGIAYWEQREEHSAKVWGGALSLVLGGGALSVVVVTLLREPIAIMLTRSAGTAWTFAAAGLYGAVMAVSTLMLATLRLRASARTYAIAAFLIVAAEMAGALTVAWLLDAPVTFMVVAWAIGSAAVSVPFLIRHLPKLRPPDGPTLSRLLRYGIPLIPATMAWLVGDLWIRGVLGREAELTGLGAYGIAYRIASVLALLVTGFGVAWYPYLYRSPAGDVARRATSALAVVVVALGGLAGVLTLLSPEIVAVVAGPPYAAAVTAVAPLTGGMVAMGVFTLAGGVIGSSGSTRRVGAAALIGMGTQVVTSLAFVPALGLTGAALSSLSGQVAAAIAAVAAARTTLTVGGRSAFVASVAGVTVALLVAHVALDTALPLRLAGAVVAALIVGVFLLRARHLTEAPSF